MLNPTLDTLRLFVHILAASVWVGGQLVLLAVVPRLRVISDTATKAAARGFERIAWPAFFVAVVSGLWNLAEVDVTNSTTAYQVTLFVKILLAMASGAAAFVHQIGNTTAAKAIGGALGLLTALGALFTGYMLTTGR